MYSGRISFKVHLHFRFCVPLAIITLCCLCLAYRYHTDISTTATLFQKLYTSCM